MHRKGGLWLILHTLAKETEVEALAVGMAGVVNMEAVGKEELKEVGWLAAELVVVAVPMVAVKVVVTKAVVTRVAATTVAVMTAVLATEAGELDAAMAAGVMAVEHGGT